MNHKNQTPSALLDPNGFCRKKPEPGIKFAPSKNRNKPAARSFFEKAMGCNGFPDKVTMDKSGANKAGMDTINLHTIFEQFYGLAT